MPPQINKNVGGVDGVRRLLISEIIEKFGEIESKPERRKVLLEQQELRRKASNKFAERVRSSMLKTRDPEFEHGLIFPFRNPVGGGPAEFSLQGGIMNELLAPFRAIHGVPSTPEDAMIFALTIAGGGLASTVPKVTRPPPGALTQQAFRGTGRPTLPRKIETELPEVPPSVEGKPLKQVRRVIKPPELPGEIKPFVTSEEVSSLTKTGVENLVRVWRTIGNPEEMASIAFAGRAKRGWFRRAAVATAAQYGKVDSLRFAGVLGATSPQITVKQNLNNSVRLWDRWEAAGRPQDREGILKVFDSTPLDGPRSAFRNNVVRALSEKDPAMIRLTGTGKAESFRRNLTGDLQAVTNDKWMARFFGLDAKEFEKQGIYIAVSAVTRKAAAILTERTGEQWLPAEVQETVWSWVKFVFEKRLSGGASMEDAIKAVTPDNLMRDVPEFAILMRGPGDGTKAAGISNRTAAAISESAIAEPRHIASTAQRLERRFAQEQLPNRVRRLHTTRAGGRRLYSRGDKGTGGEPLKTGAERLQPSDFVKKSLNNIGHNTPDLVISTGTAAGLRFHKAATAAQNSLTAGTQLTVHSPADYAGMKLFITNDSSAGFALRGDEIVTVFNNTSKGQPKVSTAMLLAAVEQGGKRLDAFDTYLTKIYADNGFRPIARIKFDRNFAPEGWDFNYYARYNKGEPDVVFMAFDPTFKGPYARKGKNSGTLVKSFEEAQRLVDDFIRTPSKRTVRRKR